MPSRLFNIQVEVKPLGIEVKEAEEHETAKRQNRLKSEKI